MILTINDNLFTIFVHAQDDCYAALWSCGFCSAMDRSLGATAELATYQAKASLFIHHTMEHELTFIGYL